MGLKICPRCGFENSGYIEGPLAQCPSCERYYAKMELPANKTTGRPAARPTAAAPRRNWRPAIFLSMTVAAVAAVAGGAYIWSDYNNRLAEKQAARDAYAAHVRAWDRWGDLSKLAGTTPRMALSAIVGRMQDARADARELPTAGCMTEMALKQFVVAMDDEIQAMMYFMAGTGDNKASGEIMSAAAKERADQGLANYRRMLGNCAAEIASTPVHVFRR